MSFYFVKDFKGACGLRKVEYWRCEVCGQTVSKTHFDMAQSDWERLNQRYHASYQRTNANPDDPRWMERINAQASTIANLSKNGFLPRDNPWIDYGCGDGKLSNLLNNAGINLLKFDSYMFDSERDYVGEKSLIKNHYDVVVNTSVFEHVRSINVLDEIAGLVSEQGVFALHVLVVECVPKDPEWFYLIPAHCAFYTNKSMQILFKRWCFKASVYHVESRMWFWFKTNVNAVKKFVQAKNDNAYCFKSGFMDYWK